MIQYIEILQIVSSVRNIVELPDTLNRVESACVDAKLQFFWLWKKRPESEKCFSSIL